MHLANVMWKPSVTVCLGQNFRGLIAANEIVKVYPDLKESVLVFSSIVNASIKVLIDMINFIAMFRHKGVLFIP